MSVELKCPACRTKLRLRDAPDPGTEIECPKCGHAFPAPELEMDDGGGVAKALPEEFKKTDKPAGDKKAGENIPKKKAPKKRKAIKHKADPRILVAVIAGGLVLLGLIVTTLVWYMGRKSAPVEMLYYLPEDADTASGANVGHAQKYVEVYKLIETNVAGAPFMRAANVVAQTMGVEGKDWLDYAVMGSGKSGGSTIVLRSKKEFDQGALAKLPGARENTAAGAKYYSVSTIEGMGRAFAPTNRIVVLCSGSIPTQAFEGMLRGNKDNPKAFAERMGAVGKRTVKGTLWVCHLFDTPPPKGEAGQPGDMGGKVEFDRTLGELLGGSKGVGYKASLGSRAVRFEFAFSCRDSEAASACRRSTTTASGPRGTRASRRASGST